PMLGCESALDPREIGRRGLAARLLLHAPRAGRLQDFTSTRSCLTSEEFEPPLFKVEIGEQRQVNDPLVGKEVSAGVGSEAEATLQLSEEDLDLPTKVVELDHLLWRHRRVGTNEHLEGLTVART